MLIMMPPSASNSLLTSTAAPLAVAIAAAAVVAITSSAVSSSRLREEKLRAETRCRGLEEELATLRKELKQRSSAHYNKNNESGARGGRQKNVDGNAAADDDDDDEQLLSQSQDPRKKQLPTIEDDITAYADGGGLFVRPVGTIRSIYKLCVGTPRQGLLAPNARGCIELEKIGDSSTSSSVIGLEGYSHIWIIFVFHLNTQSSNPNRRRMKSKISPPALGGEKVGIFATRSPHRYNPIGMTLCKIDRIEKVKKTKHTKERVFVHISGLDLVDGTPVLDIKPFVPTYDSVVSPSNNVKLPSWVEGGLATQRDVIIDTSAREELRSILEKDANALQFYGPRYSDGAVEGTLEYAMGCIRQVLAIDVRSNYQTKKAREGKFQAERAKRLQGTTTTTTTVGSQVVVAAAAASAADNICTQQLDNLLIEYTVSETPVHKRASSAGSGAEDTVTVSSIKLLEVGKK